MNKFISATVALALLAATPVFALEVGVGGSGSTGVQVGDDVNEHANSNASAQVGAHENNSDRAEVSDDNAVQANTTATVGEREGVEDDVITVTRGDVEASQNANEQAREHAAAPSAVQSKTDLSAFASATVQGDSDINDVTLSGKAVSLGYKSRAKLFGFIPVFLNSTATVNADGSVSVRYPWYAIFAATDDASLRSDIAAAVGTDVNAGATASTTLSTEAQAKVLDAIHAAMKSNLQAQLAAEGSANVSAK